MFAVVVSIEALNSNTGEGGNTSIPSFQVNCSEVRTVATRVFLSIGGSASSTGSARDYTLSGATLPLSGLSAPYVDIPAGQKSVKVTLKPIDDAFVEGAETATFSIKPNAAYQLNALSTTPITISIADNDRFPASRGGGGSRLPNSSLFGSGTASVGLFAGRRIDELL